MVRRKATHVYAICAYKESPYLEKCIQSLLRQSMKDKIIICTSTPCQYIESLSRKYSIPLYVRDGESNIKDDWNFAYNTADADFVTIAHQDDMYSKHYSEAFYEYLEKHDNASDIIIYLTGYTALKNGKLSKDINSRIRRLLRTPLKSERLAYSSFVRKMTLSLGNSICCPSVTYNKKKLGDNVFTSEYSFNIDWDTFLKLSREDGLFAYVDRALTFYRVHDGATSKEFIENNKRVLEDTGMFNQFWPKPITKLIMLFYKKAYSTYDD